MTGIRWYEKYYIQVDRLGGLVVAVAVYVALGIPRFASVASKWLDNRDDLYGALAGIFASLLGFTITALTVVLSTIDSRKLKGIRESPVYPVIWRTMKGSVRTLGFGAFAAIVGLAIDHKGEPNRYIVALIAAASFLAIMRLIRAIWIVERLVGIIAIDGSHKTSSPPAVRQSS